MSAIGGEPVDAAAAEVGRREYLGALLAWAAVAVWVAFILSLSGDQFSDVHTGAWLWGVFGALGLPPDVVEAGNFIVRKAAHFVEYAILGILAWRATHLTWPGRRAANYVAAAVVIAFVCAGADELRQYLASAARSGSPKDVLIDTAGALTGVILWSRRRRSS